MSAEAHSVAVLPKLAARVGAALPLASAMRSEDADHMRLDGWNAIPNGYGAHFDVGAAPWWLRVLFQTPFVDRFAYPLLVRRGLGVLSPHPGWPPERLGLVPNGWRLDSK